MSRIFISYRRADSAGHVGRLYDHLIQHFDKKEIFLDVGTIKPGEDFVAIIEKVVGSCDVLIAVIGPKWLDIRDENGKRKLEKPKDYVRLEIATALERDILVVPVLIERALMPSSTKLPKDLAALTRRNAIELSNDRISYDVDRLVHAIGGSYGKMEVGLGATYLSMIRARVMNPQEVIEVFMDRKRVGKIEGPGFSLTREKSKLESWLPVAVRVEEGVHKVFIRIRKSEHDPGTRSNELSFRIKGGQSISFKIERESSSFGESKVVLMPHKPIIDP